MKVDIKIPTKLEEISLGNYQKFMKASDQTNDDTFLFEKMVEIFCDIQLMEVIQIKWTDVQYIVQKITNAFQQKPDFVQTFKIENIEFGFIPNLEQMTFGEFIDLQTNIDNIEDFHKAMAVMYRPITEKRKERYLIEDYISTANYADLMKFAPVNVAMAAKVFFCDLQKDLLKATLTYLNRNLMTEDMETFQKEFSLQSGGVGIHQYMQSLEEILTSLEKQQGCPYMTALHSSLLKSKKEVSRIMRYKDN